MDKRRWCRDPACELEELHVAHAPVAAVKAEPAVRSGDVLLNITLAHVGSYVPSQISDIHQAVVNDYGTTSLRSVQRAISTLVTNRLVASLVPEGYTRAAVASPRHSGWYIRYDSAKLWAPRGLLDLMSIIEDSRRT